MRKTGWYRLLGENEHLIVYIDNNTCTFYINLGWPNIARHIPINSLPSPNITNIMPGLDEFVRKIEPRARSADYGTATYLQDPYDRKRWDSYCTTGVEPLFTDSAIPLEFNLVDNIDLDL